MLLHARADCAPPLVYFHEQSGALTLGAHGTQFSWVYRAVQEALTPEGVAISSLLTLKQARPPPSPHPTPPRPPPPPTRHVPASLIGRAPLP